MEAANTRADRRLASRTRNRTLLVAGIALLVVALMAVAVVALSGGSSSSKSAARAKPGTATDINISAGDVSAASAGVAATVTPGQAQALINQIRDYVDTATVQPLRTGKPAGDLSGVFDAGTLARVTGPDRAVMTDEGLPKVTGNLTVSSAPVPLVALADQQGNLLLVAANLQLTVDGQVGRHEAVHVTRTGDLVLAPDGTGNWKVTSYSMTVNRSGAGVDPPTTSTATSGAAAAKKGTSK
jgi:hypothetical protein